MSARNIFAMLVAAVAATAVIAPAQAGLFGSVGNRYIGTAGHCILGTSPFGGDVGEMAWAPGTGPEARDANGARIGEFAYAILQDPKDISLIRIDPQVEASAGMCHFGGPTGGNHDPPRPFQPGVVHWFGNGIVAGTA